MTAIDVVGWLAASLTLVTFVCSDMRRLRLAAIGANLAFIGYGSAAGLWPVLALHLMLTPLNLWRLQQLRSAAPPVPALAAPAQLSARAALPRRRLVAARTGIMPTCSRRHRLASQHR
jgi:hypothetical protein